ncbi:MAG: glycosyltransferase [Ferruginibacter sp.]
MAKYSIILPVRNGGHLLKQCVSSILSQTFTDFDFIVLDNCSNDGTLEWLSSITDKRIEVFSSNKSLTIEENWSRVKDIEKNEFMTLIGHDDILYPDFLQTIERLVLQQPSASLYHTHYNFIDAGSKTTRACKPMKPVYNGSQFLAALIAGSIDSMGTGYVMRSKDYDAIGGIQAKYPNLLFADFELWVSLAVKSFVAIDPHNCFAFRVHQSTTQTSGDHKLHKALHLFVDYLASIKEQDKSMHDVIQQYGACFLLHYCKAYVHRLLRLPLPARNNIRVNDLINETKVMADQLGVSSSYHPEKKSSLQLAKRIDDNNFLRFLFLQFKKLYPKPIG